MVEDEREETEMGNARRGGRSLLWPLGLIALGVAFLLDNLNIVPPLDWAAAWRYWPLALIFTGLNIVVVQARRPLGTLLSLLVTAAALVTFGYLLLGNTLWP